MQVRSEGLILHRGELSSSENMCNEPIRDALREGIERTRRKYPFEIDAWVLLPDHPHYLWTPPEGDVNFSARWVKIKRHVCLVCGARYKRIEWLSDSNKNALDQSCGNSVTGNIKYVMKVILR